MMRRFLAMTLLGTLCIGASLAAEPDGVYRVDGKPFIRRAGFGGITTFGKGLFLLQDGKDVGGERDYYTQSGLNTAFIDVHMKKQGDTYVFDTDTIDECFGRAQKAGLKVVFHLGQSIPGWLASKRNWHWIGADGSVIPNEKGRPHHDPEEYAAALTELWQPLLARYRDNPLLIGYQIAGEHHPFDSVSAKVPISYDEWTLTRYRRYMAAHFSLKEVSQRYGGREDFYAAFDAVYPVAVGNADFKGRALKNATVAKWDWYRFKKLTSVEAWAAMVKTFQKLDGHGRSIHYEYNHGPYCDIRFFPMPAVADAAPGFGLGNGAFEDSLPWVFLYAGFVKTAAREPWINNELEAGWTGSFRNDPTSIDAAYMRRQIWGNLAMGAQGYNLWTFCNLMNYTPDNPKQLAVMAAAPTFGRDRPLKYFEVQNSNRMIDSLGDVLAGSTAPRPTIGVFMLDDANFNWTYVDSYNHDALGIMHALMAAGYTDKLGIYSEYHLDDPNFKLEQLSTIILPRTPRITEAHMTRLAEYVRRGGHLILMGETGRFGEMFTELTPFPGGALGPVVGSALRLLAPEEARSSSLVATLADGKPIHINPRTAVVPSVPADVQVVAQAKGIPAIIAHRFGQGLCHYLTGECFMVDDADPTADAVALLVALGGERPAAAISQDPRRADGVFASRRIGPAGTLLFLIETGDTIHQLKVTLDPEAAGLSPQRSYHVFECFSDEVHEVSGAKGWSFATTLEAAGVRCYLITEAASIDNLLPRDRRMNIARTGRSVLLERGPWDKTAGAQRPYTSDDLLDEHRGRLTSESLHAAPSLIKTVDLGDGYTGLDIQAISLEPLNKLITDVDLGPQIFGVAPELGKSLNARLPIGAGPVRLGDVPALTGPKFLAVKREVTGLPVNQRIVSLHLFHGGHYSEHDSLIGHYLVRYTDGSVEAIPVIVQTTIGDFTRPAWRQPKYVMVHQGKDAKGKAYRLCRYDWINPWPEKTVATIDIVNAATTKNNSFKLWAITLKTTAQ